MDKNKWIQIIHVAKRDLRLQDDEYRLILQSAAGITSASELSSSFQFNQIMTAFKKLGFHSNRPRQTTRRKHENRWGCSEAQRSYIEGLWKLMSRRKDLESLEAMVKRIAHVDHPRFLNTKSATPVILAMRQMCQDQGINPDRKDYDDQR